jgi:hypothetical protein
MAEFREWILDLDKILIKNSIFFTEKHMTFLNIIVISTIGDNRMLFSNSNSKTIR